MAEYLDWGPIGSSTGKKIDISDIDRDWFEKYLFALFLKLVLPYPRQTASWTLIYAPLNVASWLKVIDHLHESRFPAHRISEVLSAVLSDNVVTDARAPRLNPLRDKEFETTLLRRRICVRPFLADLSTNVALWKTVSTFGFEHENLPLLDGIARYEVKLGTLKGGDWFNVPHSALLFWKSSLARTPSKDLRKILLDDEKGDRSAKASEIGKNGVHVLSTFEWNSKTGVAGFFLRQDVIHKMQDAGDWHLYFVRIDLWTPVTNGVKLADVQLKRQWTELGDEGAHTSY